MQQMTLAILVIPELSVQNNTRALIESARFSYQLGKDNDKFDKTTILVSLTHIILIIDLALLLMIVVMLQMSMALLRQ